jgi:choline kinase
MNNKLFCTFTSLEDIEKTLVEVKSSYDILYRKIFILYIKSNDEYVCTYNVEPSSVEEILPNTILVHRKKESNTLYTINALNELIRDLESTFVYLQQVTF